MPAGMPQAQWRAALPKGHATPQQLWQEALQIRDQLVQGNVRQLHALADSDLLQTGARFAAPDLLELGDGRRVQARAFVVATGSEARKPAQLQEQEPQERREPREPPEQRPRLAARWPAGRAARPAAPARSRAPALPASAASQG